LAAVTAHARHIALESTAFVNLEAVSSVVLWKCDTTAIERLHCFVAFRRTQLQAFALDPTGGRDDLATILHSTAAGDFVEDFLAACIDVLRADSRRRPEKTDSDERDDRLLHGFDGRS